jgi:hypothetical protein
MTDQRPLSIEIVGGPHPYLAVIDDETGVTLGTLGGSSRDDKRRLRRLLRRLGRERTEP